MSTEVAVVDVTVARPFLRALTELEPMVTQPVAPAVMAHWLIQQGLGPLAQRHCRQTWPQLATQLQADLFVAAAHNSLHFANLQKITEQFQGKLPVVLLKGVALAEQVYGGQMYRPMSDVDIWVPHAHLQQGLVLMEAAGFHFSAKEERPPALQLLSDGEMRFHQPEWVQNLVELHLSPFAGWWLVHTAAVDEEAIWQRIQPLDEAAGTYQLAAEDVVIHVAVHTAVNHQFDLALIRSLVDIALTAQKRGVDWAVVAARAKAWRVATAVYTVLHLLQQLIDPPGLQPALDALRPAAPRRWLLHRLLAPEKLLNGLQLHHTFLRFPLLLLLVDRPRDMVKLIFRTLWPEKAWLDARYGGQVGHRGHLWRMLRSGDV